MTGGSPAQTRRWHRRLQGGVRRYLAPWLPRVLGLILIAVIGSAVGAALSPSTPARVGPLLTQVRVVPSLHPGVQLLLPPAGEVHFSTHRAPLAVQARVSRVDLEGAREVLESPAELDALAAEAPDILRAATIRAAAITAACALLGALILGTLVYRRAWRKTADVAGVVALTLVGMAGVVAVTFDADRLAQPRFTGLLSQAPYVARGAPGLRARLQSYRSGLSDIVQSVTTLYATSGRLPVLDGPDTGDLITVLHVSDIHLNPLAFDLIDKLVPQFKVDAVVDSGDITTWGTEVESRVLSRVGAVGVPYVFVRGNHDSVRTQVAVARHRNAVVLDGAVKEVAGLVIAGIGDPSFTPDDPQDLAAPPQPTGGTSATPTSPTASAPPDGPGAAPAGPAPAGAAPAGGGAAAAAAGPAPGPTDGRLSLQQAANQSLAETIRRWDVAQPDRPVQLAVVHEPVGLEPLIGQAPLLLAGHTHRRSVSEQTLERDGKQVTTRIMVQGSTGGAGITSAGLRRLNDGTPLPLDATLLYIARSGPRAGQLVAYDEVTVGGFGLASVSLNRHVIRAEPANAASGEPPTEQRP